MVLEEEKCLSFSRMGIAQGSNTERYSINAHKTHKYF